MFQGSWVGDPLPVSLFCFPFCSSSPMSASVALDGIGCFTLCASTPFLSFALLIFLSFFFSLSLTLMRADLAVVGFRYLNNIYIYIYICLFMYICIHIRTNVCTFVCNQNLVHFGSTMFSIVPAVTYMGFKPNFSS